MKHFSVLFIVVAAFAVTADAQTRLKTLLTFTGSATGYDSQSNLIFDSVGNLYGTTGNSEANGADKVFQLSPNADGTWTETVLWSDDFNYRDPPTDIEAGVVFDAQGNLYGTSRDGGNDGCGAVFKLSHNSDGTWTEANLLQLDCSYGGTGDLPVGGVILDAAGNIFGTMTEGGDHSDGAVFELIPHSDGSYTENVIHSFTNGSDGGFPDHASLVFDSHRNLYGVAAEGGQQNCPYVSDSGCGTVFKLTPQPDGSWAFTVLHTFTGGSDGGNPESTLVFDKRGNLYGTTYQGGTSNLGVVFELIPHANGKWGEKVVHSFKGGGDGAHPLGGVIFDKAGNLFGTTTYGGNTQCAGSVPGCGTVYELSPNANGTMTEKILTRFHGSPHSAPYNNLLIDSFGNLYGTTSGESSGGGGVYELTP